MGTVGAWSCWPAFRTCAEGRRTTTSMAKEEVYVRFKRFCADVFSTHQSRHAWCASNAVPPTSVPIELLQPEAKVSLFGWVVESTKEHHANHEEPCLWEVEPWCCCRSINGMHQGKWWKKTVAEWNQCPSCQEWGVDDALTPMDKRERGFPCETQPPSSISFTIECQAFGDPPRQEEF